MVSKFTFNISLSVLNHLGRNLFRSFLTVLGETISNSWDADSENVWIYIDKENNQLVVKDDGDGMIEDDFQNKFLKIGYSKRKYGNTRSRKNRPFIGRKGIGKLALLSCAEKVTVISKTEGGKYIGGCIDNSGLDDAIKNDLLPDEYPLREWQPNDFKQYIQNHNKGTIIIFDDLKEGIRNTLDYLKKMIALYFRFSLLDVGFNIILDGEEITYHHLGDLANKTQYLWNINNLEDAFVYEKLTKPPLKRDAKVLLSEVNIKGFIASVEKPSDLKVITTDEKVSIDLFVNGRLRERDIIKHIPTARLVENYLYGQIHFNELDDEIDRFTSSREGIVADDLKYKKILDDLKKNILPTILEDWDRWRVEDNQDGDSENTRISKKERKSRELYTAVSEDYSIPEDSNNKVKVDGWVNDLADDAQFNFSSYAECFISENLIRNYIQDEKITLSPEATTEIKKMQQRESENLGKGNISIEIRRKYTDLSYLDMDHLAYLVDKVDKIKNAGLSRDASEYKPIRDALAHTSLLTDLAKNKLTTVYKNIKARIKTLLSNS